MNILFNNIRKENTWVVHMVTKYIRMLDFYLWVPPVSPARGHGRKGCRWHGRKGCRSLWVPPVSPARGHGRKGCRWHGRKGCRSLWVPPVSPARGHGRKGCRSLGSRPCLPQGDTGERGAGAFGFHPHCPPPLGVGETVRGLNPIVQHFPSLQSLPTKEGLLRSRAYPTQRPVPETWLAINKCYRFF
jgi:hypothetical protein